MSDAGTDVSAALPAQADIPHIKSTHAAFKTALSVTKVHIINDSLYIQYM
jgi:hypothetical protein